MHILHWRAAARQTRVTVRPLRSGPAPAEPPTVHAALTRYAIVRRELDLLAAIRENTSEVRRLREAVQAQDRSRRAS
jgi:hypothetical protein